LKNQNLPIQREWFAKFGGGFPAKIVDLLWQMCFQIRIPKVEYELSKTEKGHGTKLGKRIELIVYYCRTI
jgi:hypothetical protein